MEEIKCTSYEKREFIRLLEYAKKMKLQNRPSTLNNNGTRRGASRWDDTEYDIQQIELLIQRVKGIAPEKNYIKDSLKATHESREDYEESNRQKFYYDKRQKR